MAESQYINFNTYKGVNYKPILLKYDEGSTSLLKTNKGLNINEYGLIDIILQTENRSEIQEYLSKNIGTNEIEISGVKFKFTDIVWDFTSQIPVEKKNIKAQHRAYVYDFKNTLEWSDYYQTIFRLFLLNHLLQFGLHRTFIKNDFQGVLSFIKYLEKKEIQTIDDISLKDIVSYFGTFKVKEHTLSGYKTTIKKLFDFYFRITDSQVDENIITWLNTVDVTKKRIEAENGKHPLLPQSFMSNLIQILKEEIYKEDTTLTEDYKISCGLLYLITQTGIRPYELVNIPFDCLENKSKYGIEMYSFKYYTTKDIYGSGSTEVETFATKEMVKVINQIQKITIGSHTLCGNITYEVIKKTLENICVNYSNRLGNITTTPDARYSAKAVKMSDGTYINIPNMKQFRVYVNSELKRRGMSTFQIANIFGHHDEKMLDYYERTIEDKENDEYTNMIISDVLDDETNVLGPKGNEYTEVILDSKNKTMMELYANDFYDTNKESLKTDLSDEIKVKVVENVVKYMSTHYPIRQLSVGCCIRPHVLATCENSRGADEYMCAYGLCANQCHFYFDSDTYYNKFKEWKEIVFYNINEGHTIYAEKELFKLQKMLNNKLVPELLELKRMLENKGSENIIAKHANLETIIKNLDSIEGEVNEWKNMNIKKAINLAHRKSTIQ